jgi:molybdopterin adenylyltransferase
MKYKTAVLTISDKCSCGERKDISGQLLKQNLEEKGFEVVFEKILPDDFEKINETLKNLCDLEEVSLVLTTGGTGFSLRDITPEATKSVIEREAIGISEMIRAESAKITKRAYLSRGVSGIRNKTLIINLPGSPKSVTESLEIIKDILVHGLDILTGHSNECGTDQG